MAALKPPPLVIHFGGTSFTNGPLSTPDKPWTLELLNRGRVSQHCKGELRFVNTGKGSQQSTWGVAQAAIWAPQRPDVLWTEGYGINNCAPLPTIRDTVDCDQDLEDITTAYRAENPNLIAIHQTMSSASADDVFRSGGVLRTYYEAELAKAASLDMESLDLWQAWPDPLPDALTQQNDKLHPTWDAYKTRSFPLQLARLETLMQEFWS